MRADGQSLERWFNTSPSIWVQRPPDTLRTAQLRSPNIRRHSTPQLDAALMKEVRLAERHAVQFRLSAFNATNSPIFDFPNTNPTARLFGVVPPSQLNLPRNVEIGLRYAF